MDLSLYEKSTHSLRDPKALGFLHIKFTITVKSYIMSHNITTFSVFVFSLKQ